MDFGLAVEGRVAGAQDLLFGAAWVLNDEKVARGDRVLLDCDKTSRRSGDCDLGPAVGLREGEECFDVELRSTF